MSEPMNASGRTPRISESRTFMVAAGEVWQLIGTFRSVQKWQASVARCGVEESDEGIIRTVVMRDGTAFVERLESFSNLTRIMSYSMISGPVPVEDYQAEIRVDDVRGRGRVTISADYRAGPGADAGLIDEELSQLFRTGLQGMALLLDA